jgi:hypothetical protein
MTLIVRDHSMLNNNKRDYYNSSWKFELAYITRIGKVHPITGHEGTKWSTSIAIRFNLGAR